ncbi:MAG: hypothetical protein IKV15_00520 [Bacteroidaceae bacterium]|nr:hypothetical protein [Bacteroidaceae bacterium]
MNKYSYWDTVMEYLPNYHNRSDVLLSDILARYIDDEEVDDGDLKMIETNYGSEKQAVKQALFELDSRLIVEAMKVLYEVEG